MQSMKEVIDGLVAKSAEFYGQCRHHPTCVAWDAERGVPHEGLFDLELVPPTLVVLPVQSELEPQWNEVSAAEIIKTQRRKLK